jgi:type VI protein secretion system component Hcp
MAFRAFIKFDGIEGPSNDKLHKGEFEVLSWAWGVKQAVSPTGGAGSGKPQSTEFSFNMQPSSGSVAIVGSVCAGAPIDWAIFVAEEGSGQKAKGNAYIKYTMSDVIISSYQLGGAEGSVPTDSVSLVFKKLELEYKDPQGDGSKASTCDFAWDIKEK